MAETGTDIDRIQHGGSAKVSQPPEAELRAGGVPMVDEDALPPQRF
jgi:hypothetical protein